MEIRQMVYSLIELADAMELHKDVTKFEEGNNAAGTRIRNAMQDVKTMAQDIRIAVQNEKKSRKKK